MARRFQNLFPEDIPITFGRSTLSYRDDKWIEITYNGSIRSATGRYNFVCLEGHVYISKTSRRLFGRTVGHLDLARGQLVTYAGQIQFSRRGKRGLMRWWNNSSGHYRPAATDASQAGLPKELFVPGSFLTGSQAGIFIEE